MQLPSRSFCWLLTSITRLEDHTALSYLATGEQAELAGTQLPDGHTQNPTRVSSAMDLPEAYKLSLGACSSASLTGTKVPGLIN